MSRLRIDILRAYIKFYEKPIFFMTYVKTTNKTFFTDDTQHVGFMWNHFVNV
jgi:hypothetical protein